MQSKSENYTLLGNVKGVLSLNEICVQLSKNPITIVEQTEPTYGEENPTVSAAGKLTIKLPSKTFPKKPTDIHGIIEAMEIRVIFCLCSLRQ